MIVRTRHQETPSSVSNDVTVREMVKLDDGMGVRLLDIDMEPNSEFSVQDLLCESQYTAALFTCSGSQLAALSQHTVQMSSNRLIGFSSSTECTVTAQSVSRLLLVACIGASYEGIVVRTLDEIEETERSVAWGNGLSQRYLLERDSLGFAFCYTIGNSNTDSHIQYTNHLEACYYLSGSGEYVWEDDSHPILTGNNNATMFVMDNHDQHRMVVHDRSVCISVFCPPIAGQEKHNFSTNKPSVY